MRKYEKFTFFDISDLNREMEEEWKDYKIISITKSYDEDTGSIFTAWIVKK